MTEEPMTTITSRIRTKVETSPVPVAFDASIIDVLLPLIMDLFASCFGAAATPESAAVKLAHLGPFQRAALDSRLRREVRRRGLAVPHALTVATARAACDCCEEATDEERLAMVTDLVPLAADDFTWGF